MDRALHTLRWAGSGLGKFAMGLVGLAIAVIIPAAFFAIFVKGSVWTADLVLPWLTGAGWVLLAVDVLLFLPASLIRSLRPFTGMSIYLSSFLFGTVLWFLGLLITYKAWGGFAVAVGLFLLGIGVVPIAMLAMLFKGEWSVLLSLIALAALTLGARVGGVAIRESGSRHSLDYPT